MTFRGRNAKVNRVERLVRRISCRKDHYRGTASLIATSSGRHRQHYHLSPPQSCRHRSAPQRTCGESNSADFRSPPEGGREGGQRGSRAKPRGRQAQEYFGGGYLHAPQRYQPKVVSDARWRSGLRRTLADDTHVTRPTSSPSTLADRGEGKFETQIFQPL